MPSSSVNHAGDQPRRQLEVNLTPRVIVNSNRAVNVVVRIGNTYHQAATPPRSTATPPSSTRHMQHMQWEWSWVRHMRRMIRKNPTPVTAGRYRMEKLEEKEEQRDLKSCSICLDEIDHKKCECVRIVCGHVYHKPCILAWLNNSNSCPMCRTRLPLQEGSN